jgi:hypothetical protein
MNQIGHSRLFRGAYALLGNIILGLERTENYNSLIKYACKKLYCTGSSKLPTDIINSVAFKLVSSLLSVTYYLRR